MSGTVNDGKIGQNETTFNGKTLLYYSYFTFDKYRVC